MVIDDICKNVFMCKVMQKIYAPLVTLLEMDVILNRSWEDSGAFFKSAHLKGI